MDISSFRNRIEYTGNLNKLFEIAANEYKIGKYISFTPVLRGYEDFNNILTTENGKYFIKIMASSRSDKDVKQYVSVMRTAVDNGISHPKLYECSRGDLFSSNLDDTNIRLVVMDYIKPLVDLFPRLNIEKLPHCFVHGDIISTNVIRSIDNKIFIIDFAVANIYPRIQELAILLCDLFLVKDKDKYLFNYNLALEEYQKVLLLAKEEIEILPTYIKLAHAMHIIPATREKVKGTELKENDYWLRSGKEGIRFAYEIWD